MRRLRCKLLRKTLRGLLCMSLFKLNCLCDIAGHWSLVTDDFQFADFFRLDIHDKASKRDVLCAMLLIRYQPIQYTMYILPQSSVEVG